MPVPATHSSMRARSSSSSRNRRRTGSRPARSITCEAVTRPPARSRRAATAASTGLVRRMERSARRTCRSGGRAPEASPGASGSSTPTFVNVAWISGAKASMSGHMTMTSRGSSVGSSARSVEHGVAQHLDLAGPTVAGVDLDAAVTGGEHGPAVGLAGQRRARRCPVGADVGREPAEQRGSPDRRVAAGSPGIAGPSWCVARPGPSGRRRRARPASRGRRGPRRPAGGGGRAGGGIGGPVGGAAGAVDQVARRAHRAGEGWRRNRLTSRPAPRAWRTSR